MDLPCPLIEYEYTTLPCSAIARAYFSTSLLEPPKPWQKITHGYLSSVSFDGVNFEQSSTTPSFNVNLKSVDSTVNWALMLISRMLSSKRAITNLLLSILISMIEILYDQ